MSMRRRAGLGVILMALLLLATGCVAAKVRAGDRAAHAGRWMQALAHYQKALSRKPDDKRIQQRVEQAKIEVAKIFVRRGEEAARRGELVTALQHYTEALAYDAGSPDAQRGQNRVADQLVDRGKKAQERGDLETAAVTFRAVWRVVPSYQGIGKLHADASDAFATKLREDAQKDFDNDWCGNALVQAARSLTFVEASDAHRVMQQARQCLVARNVINPVFGPNPHRSLLSDAVTGNLYRDIQSVPGFRPAARMHGPRRNAQKQTVIFVELLNHQELEDEEKEHKIHRESRDGTETRAYDQLVDQKEELEGEIADLEEKKESLNTPSSLEEVNQEIEEKKAELAEVTEQMEEMEDQIVEFPYDVITVTHRSVAQWRLRLEDPVIGRWEQTVDVEVSATDTEIPEVRGANTLDEDPLELPTWDELANQLSGRSTEVLFETLAQAREERRAKIVAQGASLEAQGQERKAIEAYADAAFLPPPPPQDNRAASYIAFKAETQWPQLVTTR